MVKLADMSDDEALRAITAKLWANPCSAARVFETIEASDEADRVRVITGMQAGTGGDPVVHDGSFGLVAWGVAPNAGAFGGTKTGPLGRVRTARPDDNIGAVSMDHLWAAHNRDLLGREVCGVHVGYPLSDQGIPGQYLVNGIDTAQGNNINALALAAAPWLPGNDAKTLRVLPHISALFGGHGLVNRHRAQEWLADNTYMAVQVVALVGQGNWRYAPINSDVQYWPGTQGDYTNTYREATTLLTPYKVLPAIFGPGLFAGVGANTVVYHPYIKPSAHVYYRAQDYDALVAAGLTDGIGELVLEAHMDAAQMGDNHPQVWLLADSLAGYHAYTYSGACDDNDGPEWHDRGWVQVECTLMVTRKLPGAAV